MGFRKVFIGVFLVMVIGWGGYVGYRYVSSRNEKCSVCARIVHRKVAAEAILKSGSRSRTCCARCALHFALQNPNDVVQLRVSDEVSGDMVAADGAWYVEGSDAQGCHPDPGADEMHPLREPGVIYDVAFDRCIPSLLAFRSESAAHEFRRQNGGTVLTYSEVLESVRNR